MLKNGTVMQIQYPTSDWLALSWDRSSQAGLKQRYLPDHVTLSNIELKERKWSANKLINAIETYALPLFNQIFAHSDSRLILTDSEGVILSSWGQPRFKERLLQIALDSGACWQEQFKGTNAIGTALVEEKPISIIGMQHFIYQHQFISCSASPIFDHQGDIIGILDITSEQHQHDLSTQVLLQNMVQLIENHLLCEIPHSAERINIACEKTLLNSGWQGVLITDETGKILAHNHIASQLLDQTSVVGRSMDSLLTQIPNNLVIEHHPLNKQSRFSRRNFSESCELHFGDIHVEQAWQFANKVIDKDIAILIHGETGVGKGEFVKALHRRSNRSQNPLVIVNCGAIPKDLIESELFGYVSGAFTGANTKGYQGKIRLADKGTLFLDEIADMPLEAQSRLLHVLQDKVVVPVGSNRSEEVNIQIIAATHKNLDQQVAKGEFRQDLYYRLQGLLLTLPPLREREDRVELIRHIHRKHRLHQQEICPKLIDILQHYTWPGNIRELDNMLKVSCLLASDEPILQLEHIPGHVTKCLVGPMLGTSRADENIEHTIQDLKSTLDSKLVSTYQATQGNISKTSRLLGISRNTIYRKLKSLGVLN
jgi:sigma-54 dependent transcriptional regulator, acetoin dehydrogenase operon transcriptional activator AcoR